MKYDVIIIGGGLSGLMAGIKLMKRGFSAAIVSTGQSALHFCSGSLGLLGNIDGRPVDNPMDTIEFLPVSHPYRKIGSEALPLLAEESKSLLSEAGLTFTGTHIKNHYRLTPFGKFEPAWLTLSEYATCNDPYSTGWKKATVVNFKGYLDFFPDFLETGIRSHGSQCDTAIIDVPEITSLILTSSETRAITLARAINGTVMEALATRINSVAGESDIVFMPAVVGIDSEQPIRRLRDMVRPKLMCVPTLPLSVCGPRSHICLRRYFEKLGGVYFLGDKVLKGCFDGDRLREIETSNFGDMHLRADHFILATGSFFSQGLVSTPEAVNEPVLGADVFAANDRGLWCCKNILGSQPYMSFGVDTDADFKIMVSGKKLENVYAIGSVLGGSEPIKEGSGGGVAILTALHVARNISKSANIC